MTYQEFEHFTTSMAGKYYIRYWMGEPGQLLVRILDPGSLLPLKLDLNELGLVWCEYRSLYKMSSVFSENKKPLANCSEGV